MQWQRVDRYHMTSDSGYNISNSFSPGLIYTAWGPGVFPDRSILLCTDDLDEAKFACQRHQQDKACSA